MDMQADQERPPAILVTDESGRAKTIEEVEGITECNYTPASDLSAICAVEPFNQRTTREIIRQVEYYFSDQNLPTDQHLLGLSGSDGNGPVDLNHICQFKKMRKYKPRTAIKEVLRKSAAIDLVDGGKKIKRRFPLVLPILVMPNIDIEHEHIERKLAENPHLTKGMLKPTGFEDFYTDPPISPQQYEKDRKLYDHEFSFDTRIENALRHYRARRKMHQSTRTVFEKWMMFGGIDTSPLAYTGGMSDEGEVLDKEERAALRYSYSVDNTILDNENNHKVDFELTALVFLSIEFPFVFDSSNATVREVCNIMVNFYNFLLHHDVCPEYAEQILSARRAVKEAEPALCKVPAANQSFQSTRGFNAACAVLHSERYASPDLTKATWLIGHTHGLTVKDATVIFKAGLAAFASYEQLTEIEARYAAHATTGTYTTSEPAHGAMVPKFGITKHVTFSMTVTEGDNDDDDDDDSETVIEGSNNRVRQRNVVHIEAATPRSPFAVVFRDTIGLEITGLEKADDCSAAVLDRLTGMMVPKLGLMHCRTWNPPNAAYQDAPADQQRLPDTLKFIVEDKVLEECEVGMKLEAEVCMLDIGICWLEQVERVHPRFYTSMPDFKAVKQQRRDAEWFDEWLNERARQEVALAHFETLDVAQTSHVVGPAPSDLETCNPHT